MFGARLRTRDPSPFSEVVAVYYRSKPAFVGVLHVILRKWIPVLTLTKLVMVFNGVHSILKLGVSTVGEKCDSTGGF